MSYIKNRKDKNEKDIVKKLLSIPGFSVELNHGDILCGFRGITLWVEIKSDRAVSRRTGKILESQVRKSQKEIRDTFKGAYLLTTDINEILSFFGIK
jgi:hypothetical protein